MTEHSLAGLHKFEKNYFHFGLERKKNEKNGEISELQQ